MSRLNVGICPAIADVHPECRSYRVRSQETRGREQYKSDARAFIQPAIVNVD